MKQIVKYQVKNLVTDKVEEFNSLEEAKQRALYIRHLGIGALVYRKTTNIFNDNVQLVEF